MGLIVEGIDEAIEFIGNISESAVVGTAIEVESRLREETPVDTGYARNSWITTDDPEDIGTPGENTPAQKLAVLQNFRLGETVYINNGCDYIESLNDGHSKQAPYGMTYKVMPEVPDIVRDQVEDAERAGR